MPYHLVRSAHENGDSARVSAFFNDKHLILCCTKGNFPHNPGFAELLWRQILESRNDAAICSDCYELGNLISIW